MRTLIAAVLIASLLTGCSSGFPGYRPLSYSNNSEARAYISPGLCMHSPRPAGGEQEIAAIPAALALQAIGLAFDKFNTALKNGTAAGDLPSSNATLNFEPDKGRIPGCVLVVRGQFANGDTTDKTTPLQDFLLPALTAEERATSQWPEYQAAVAANRLPPQSSYKGEAQAAKWMRMSALWHKEILRTEMSQRLKLFNLSSETTLLNSVDHIFEIQIILSANGNYLSMAPVYARVDRSIDDDRRGRRSFVISIEFATAKDALLPDKTGTKYGALMQLRNFKLGQASAFPPVTDGRLRFSNESSWFPVFNGASPGDTPAQPKAKAPPKGKYTVEDSPSRGSAAVGANDIGNALQSTHTDSTPMRLTTRVVETRPNKEGREFLAQVFDGTKDVLQAAATAKIQTAEQRKTQRATEITSEIQALQSRAAAENLAVQKVREYCSALVGADDSLTSRTNRITKIKSANHEVLALAGLTSPPGQILYGGLLDNTDAIDNATNVNICKRLDANQKW